MLQELKTRREFISWVSKVTAGMVAGGSLAGCGMGEDEDPFVVKKRASEWEREGLEAEITKLQQGIERQGLADAFKSRESGANQLFQLAERLNNGFEDPMVYKKSFESKLLTKSNFVELGIHIPSYWDQVITTVARHDGAIALGLQEYVFLLARYESLFADERRDTISLANGGYRERFLYDSQKKWRSLGDEANSDLYLEKERLRWEREIGDLDLRIAKLYGALDPETAGIVYTASVEAVDNWVANLPPMIYENPQYPEIHQAALQTIPYPG